MASRAIASHNRHSTAASFIPTPDRSDQALIPLRRHGRPASNPSSRCSLTAPDPHPMRAVAQLGEGGRRAFDRDGSPRRRDPRIGWARGVRIAGRPGYDGLLFLVSASETAGPGPSGGCESGMAGYRDGRPFSGQSDLSRCDRGQDTGSRCGRDCPHRDPGPDDWIPQLRSFGLTSRVQGRVRRGGRPTGALAREPEVPPLSAHPCLKGFAK